MSRRRPVPSRRGLTLLELMLSLTITAMVAAAIAAMLGAVTTGVLTRKDVRSIMIRAHAAQTRLAAYVAPSRCLLDASPTTLTVWQEDTRKGDSIHASEVRWIRLVPGDGAIDVLYVTFPGVWTRTAVELADQEHAAGSSWDHVLADYEANGWISTFRLIDGVTSLVITTDQADPHMAAHATFEMVFEADELDETILVAASIRDHRPPSP